MIAAKSELVKGWKGILGHITSMQNIFAVPKPGLNETVLSQFLLHPVAMWKTSMEVTTNER